MVTQVIYMSSIPSYRCKEGGYRIRQVFRFLDRQSVIFYSKIDVGNQVNNDDDDDGPGPSDRLERSKLQTPCPGYPNSTDTGKYNRLSI